MEDSLILIEEYCSRSRIEINFVDSLEELGLIKTVTKDEQRFLPDLQLTDLEKFTEWFYEFDINPAGIDTIHRLLQKMETMQLEIEQLRKQLKLFE